MNDNSIYYEIRCSFSRSVPTALVGNLVTVRRTYCHTQTSLGSSSFFDTEIHLPLTPPIHSRSTVPADKGSTRDALETESKAESMIHRLPTLAL